MNRLMTAAMLYGPDDLKVERVPVPEPGPGDALVRVKTALTCGTDLKTYHRGAHVMIPSLPSPFGHEFAGILEKAPEGVTNKALVEGAAVIAANSAPCMVCDYCKAGRHNLCDDLQFLNGAYAEYIVVPERIARCNLHPIPEGMDLARAALTEPLACVLHGIDRLDIKMGETVCVTGVGPIGLMMVGLAAYKGAKVIAVGRSPMKLERAKKMGAYACVSTEDVDGWTDEVRALTPFGRGPDVVVEAVGRPEAWEAAVSLVKKGGRVNLFGGCAKGSVVRFDAYDLHYREKTLLSVFHHTPYYVSMALQLLETGVIDHSNIISHRMPLDELMNAFSLVENKKAVKIAIEIPD